MALKIQASFAAGEFDPALRKRITLERYSSGLATARNIVIGKTGRIVSRPGRKWFVKTKTSGKKVKIHVMSNLDSFLEWGHLYVRVYSMDDGQLIGDYSHLYTEAQLDDIHFADCDEFNVYIFQKNQQILKLSTIPGGGFYPGNIFVVPPTPTVGTITVGGTGYDVDYYVTAVIGGQETDGVIFNTSSPKLPITSATKNTLVAVLGSTFTHAITPITEMRVYRRPKGAGAFGYIGSAASTAIAAVSTDMKGTFDDVGQAADYSHGPPTANPDIQSRAWGTIQGALPQTGVVYQQRLVVASGNLIEASRTAYQTNFYRDYPYADDSSLSMKTQSGGSSRVLRMIDSDGLVAFTDNGVFLNTGALGVSNLSFDRKGNWVIDERVPPIAIPGGVLFIDALTNTVRKLTFSLENGSYLAEELSVFSDHLFTGKRIISWAYEIGDLPLLWVVYDDGTFASFTYENEQLMRAWTRHDSTVTVEFVAATIQGYNQNTGLRSLGKSIWVTKSPNGDRHIELGVPRFVSASVKTADTEYELNNSNAFFDSMVSWKSLKNNSISNGDLIALVPVTAGIWDGSLTMTCGTSALFPNTAGHGAVGSIFRWFNPDDQTSLDFTVTARASSNQVTVTPSGLFPSDKAASIRLYETATSFSGLGHMEGENVSVMVDGYIFASPFNDTDGYPLLTVVNGAISLPSSYRGAIVHIGRPITADIETLDIDTVEQRPVFYESKTVNKVIVDTYRSRGLFAGNTFPANNAVTDMEDLTKTNVEEDAEGTIQGNHYLPATSEELEVMLQGDWASQGRVCLRQVDGYHFELLAIVPDLEDERR